MNAADGNDYGLWSLVLINSAFFILFAASFFRPQTRQDWRTLGMFSAFVVALFTEMYGFPLTLYLLSGWLAERVPGVDFLAHDAGHLLEVLFGWQANPHFGPFHLLSNVFIIGGFWLLAAGEGVAGALRGAESGGAGPHRPVRAHPPPAVRRVHADHDRLPAAVAHLDYRGHIPDSRGLLLQAGPA